MSTYARLGMDHILTDFRKKINESLSLANDAVSLKELRGNTYRNIRKSKTYLIVELSFLQLFISWEQFLEQTFVRYMCGGITCNGYSPKRFVQPKTLEHAGDIIMQGRPYVDWTKLDEVITKAELYFDKGEPFADTLRNASAQLEDMKMLRNRITHRSKHSEEKFRGLVLQKMGYNPRGMVPGRFLLEKIPRSSARTVLQQYGDLILALGNLIVP